MSVGTLGWSRKFSSGQPRQDIGNDGTDCHLDLFHVGQVLDADVSGVNIAIAGDEGDSRTGTIGLAQTDFDSAVTVCEVYPHPGGAQLRGQPGECKLRLLPQWYP